MRMRRTSGNLLRSGEADYVSPIVFHTYRAGQTNEFPVPAFVPPVPINGAITYTRTLIQVFPIPEI